MALAAGLQGKYRAFHDAMFATGDVTAAAEAAGLDMERAARQSLVLRDNQLRQRFTEAAGNARDILRRLEDNELPPEYAYNWRERLGAITELLDGPPETALDREREFPPPAQWLSDTTDKLYFVRLSRDLHRVPRPGARAAAVGQAVGAEHQHITRPQGLKRVHIGPQRGGVAHQIDQRNDLLQHAMHAQFQGHCAQPGQAANGVQRHHLAPDTQKPVDTPKFHWRAVIALVGNGQIEAPTAEFPRDAIVIGFGIVSKK